MSISTHVLDAVTGRPAAGIAVTLEFHAESGWIPVGSRHTDDDGRVADFAADPSVGVFRLGFQTGPYFGGETFYPEVHVIFQITDGSARHHVPLLLSPFGYSTYRGS